jgi:hypothetical protein
VLLAACTPVAVQTCREGLSPLEEGRQVVAGYETTVGYLRATSGRDLSAWSELEDDRPAALCYVDGDFAKAPPPGSSGRSYDRGLFAVSDGRSELLVLGYQDSMPTNAPWPPGQQQ